VKDVEPNLLALHHTFTTKTEIPKTINFLIYRSSVPTVTLVLEYTENPKPKRKLHSCISARFISMLVVWDFAISLVLAKSFRKPK
jgi:hypothetical protein